MTDYNIMQPIDSWKRTEVNMIKGQEMKKARKWTKFENIVTLSVAGLFLGAIGGLFSWFSYMIDEHVWTRWVTTTILDKTTANVHTLITRTQNMGTYRHALSTDLILNGIIGVVFAVILLVTILIAEDEIR